MPNRLFPACASWLLPQFDSSAASHAAISGNGWATRRADNEQLLMNSLCSVVMGSIFHIIQSSHSVKVMPFGLTEWRVPYDLYPLQITFGPFTKSGNQ